MLALLRVHRNKFLAGLALLIVCGAGLGIREALSADADLQQYNGSAVWANDLTAASTPFRETESESRPTATPWVGAGKPQP